MLESISLELGVECDSLRVVPRLPSLTNRRAIQRKAGKHRTKDPSKLYMDPSRASSDRGETVCSQVQIVRRVFRLVWGFPCCGYRRTRRCVGIRPMRRETKLKPFVRQYNRLCYVSCPCCFHRRTRRNTVRSSTFFKSPTTTPSTNLSIAASLHSDRV